MSVGQGNGPDRGETLAEEWRSGLVYVTSKTFALTSDFVVLVTGQQIQYTLAIEVGQGPEAGFGPVGWLITFDVT